jgi:hypothetical protein
MAPCWAKRVADMKTKQDELNTSELDTVVGGIDVSIGSVDTTMQTTGGGSGLSGSLLGQLVGSAISTIKQIARRGA